MRGWLDDNALSFFKVIALWGGRIVIDLSLSPPRLHPPDYQGAGGKWITSGLISGQFAARIKR